MFVYEVVGYAYDGAAYCEDHTPSRRNPIFAGDEGEYHCDTCLDQIISQYEGWQRQKHAQDALLDTVGKGQGARYERERRKRARHASRIEMAKQRALNTIRHAPTNLKPLREAILPLARQRDELSLEINVTKATLNNLRHAIAVASTYPPTLHSEQRLERQYKEQEQAFEQRGSLLRKYGEIGQQLEKLHRKYTRLKTSLETAEEFLSTYCDMEEHLARYRERDYIWGHLWRDPCSL